MQHKLENKDEAENNQVVYCETYSVHKMAINVHQMFTPINYAVC